MEIDKIVKEFHDKFGVPIKLTPGVPSEDRVRLRLALIAEEFFELLEASLDGPVISKYAVMEHIQGSKLRGPTALDVDLVEVADALGDLDYVVAGTRLEFGIPGAEVMKEIHESNMAKVGGPTRDDGKIMKPENWSPPDIEGVLRKAGWKYTR